MKSFISAHEYLNGQKRWCLWLVGISQEELNKMPLVLKRIDEVKKMRLNSTKAATVKWAQSPTLFTENRQPNSNYVLVPSHSSENRNYVPYGFLTKDDILNNSCFSIPNADLYLFGIVSSKMHMAWMQYICGRIKSDYRYSNTIVYNNYPFPENVSEAQKQKVEKAAQAVLDSRETYTSKGKSLANLYDPLSMPPDLKTAHDALDKAVDECYGKMKFTSDAKRVGYLFELYDGLVKGETAKKSK